jgi:hypothetical protein
VGKVGEWATTRERLHPRHPDRKGCSITRPKKFLPHL